MTVDVAQVFISLSIAITNLGLLPPFNYYFYAAQKAQNVFIIPKRRPILPSNVLASMSFTSHEYTQNSLNRGSADGTAMWHVRHSFRTV